MNTVENFFKDHRQALPIYKQLETFIKNTIPDVKIYVQKTQITFTNKHVFGCVSFLKIRHDMPFNYLTLSLGLSYPHQSDKISAIVEPYPGRFTHHIILSHQSMIDNELNEMIHEAAIFSNTKKRRSK